jgi:CRP-like cAMP-binding protein
MIKNAILRSLPQRELKLLTPQLQSVDLQKGSVLYDAGQALTHVYFPVGAMVSYLSSTAEGQTIEVCVVGNEGMIGGPAMLSDAAAFRTLVQIRGGAFRMSVEALRREFNRCDGLHNILLNYTHALLLQVAQTAVCNRFHSIEQRFSRWLLLAVDRSQAKQLSLTQDELARIFGARRASVTVVAGGMQKGGVIRYSRGVIEIVDRKRLEQTTCECYEIISGAYRKTRA